MFAQNLALTVFSILICVHWTYAKAKTNSDACSFNSNCFCVPLQGNQLYIECDDCATFPTFDSFNATGLSLDIFVNGSFSNVPANAIYPLFGSTDILFTAISANSNSFDQIVVDQQAFNTEYTTNFFEVTFEQYSFPYSFPISALYSVSQLEFQRCDIPKIPANAFAGFSGDIIIFLNTKTDEVDQNAFNGLDHLEQFGLDGNLLTYIPEAFSYLKTDILSLSANLISGLSDYSFSLCSNTSCPNSMKSLLLNHNPLGFITAKAFANMPTLKELELDHCTLTSVPSSCFGEISNLLSLKLKNNSITNIQANSFYQLSKLLYLDLDDNPATTLEPGAFNGLTSMTFLQLNNLHELTTVDLLIAYGMTNAKNVSISNSLNLNTVLLSDYTKLPTSVKNFNLSSNNITNVSPNVQYWLNVSSENKLDISYNVNFDCNTAIQWMTNYVCCTPAQIIADGTLCAGTKQSLKQYLTSFQPTCDTFRLKREKL